MMHFVRAFLVMRAKRKAYCYQRGSNYGKIVYIKSIFENGWWKNAYPSSYPPGSAPGHKLQNRQKSLAYFSHLAPLNLFFFTKEPSQKEGMVQCSPPTKHAAGLFFYYWRIYPTITRKRRIAVRARLGVASHLSTTLRWGNSVKCLSQRHNK